MAKILVVEDNDDTRDLVKRLLTPVHDVSTVGAWVYNNSFVFSEKLDLILVDVRMPVVGGDDLTRILKRALTGPKVVLFSALDEGTLRRRAQAANADGWIKKDLQRAALLKAVAPYLPPEERSQR